MPEDLLTLEKGGLFVFCFLFFVFLSFFRAAPAAYGGSQARGPIGAVAAGLHYTIVTAMPDP